MARPSPLLERDVGTASGDFLVLKSLMVSRV
jgi:hypothetical protein